MTRPTTLKIGGILAAVAAVAVAAVVTPVVVVSRSQADSTYAGIASNGVVAVDCDASTPALDSDCQHSFGETFQVGFFVVEPPADGYFTIESKMDWGNSVITWQPGDSASDEAVWEDCTIAARDPEPNLGEGTDPPLVFACTPLPSLPSGKTTTGNLLVFDFQCLTEASPDLSPPGTLPSTSLALVDPGAPGGTWFGDALGNIITPSVDPASSTITCGPAPTPTVTSTPTATPAATATPTPTPTPVKVDVTVESTTGRMQGFFGTVDFPLEPAAQANVMFSDALPSADYGLLLTPVNRACQPQVVAKSASGFSFTCPASGGGSVDWAVLVDVVPSLPGRPPGRPPGSTP